jgi:aconitase A
MAWLISYRGVVAFNFQGNIRFNVPRDVLTVTESPPEVYLLEAKRYEQEVRDTGGKDISHPEQFEQIEVIYFARKIDDDVAEELGEYM